MKRTHIHFLYVSVILLLCGCKSSQEPSSSKQNGNEFLKCADIGGDSNVERISLPPLTLVRDNQDLKISGIASSIIRVGLLAGIHEITPQTERNINGFLNQFKAAKVQAIVVVGGVGKTKKQITEVLRLLAKAPIPILITPGAQESFGAFKSAIKSLKKNHPQLVDLTQVRRIQAKHVNFISLPGYFNPFYLEAKSQGCSYEEAELAQIINLAVEDKTNVLLSATPPKGVSANAPDMGRGNINIGDPKLTQALKQSPIKFGLFGHVYESASNAVGKEKTEALQPGIWHPTMYLQAGSADAIPVALINGGRTAGVAHIVDFSGHRARFKPMFANHL